MGSVLLSRHRLRVNNISYFRSHPDDVRLGSMGRKRWSLVRSNYLDVKHTISLERLPSGSIRVGELGINDQQSSNLSLAGSIMAVLDGVPVAISGNAAAEMFRKSELRLLKLSVDNNVMRDVINQSPRDSQELLSWGIAGRVAHQVYVVMEAKLTSIISRAGVVRASEGAGGTFEITVGASNQSRTTVKISPETGFAYLLARPIWTRSGVLRRRQPPIRTLRTDQWGVG